MTSFIMCQTRAYRHKCGHYLIYQLSACRCTFHSKNTGTPRCLSAPPFAISLDFLCHACEYRNFCSFWHSQIRGARLRAGMIIPPELMPDDSISMDTIADDWSDEPLDKEELENWALMYEPFSSSRGPMLCEDEDEEASFRAPATEVEAEVYRLEAAFRDEKLIKWPFEPTDQEEMFVPQQKKRPNVRCVGGSPLKNCVNACDIESDSKSDTEMKWLDVVWGNEAEEGADEAGDQEEEKEEEEEEDGGTTTSTRSGSQDGTNTHYHLWETSRHGESLLCAILANDSNQSTSSRAATPCRWKKWPQLEILPEDEDERVSELEALLANLKDRAEDMETDLWIKSNALIMEHEGITW